MEGACVRVRELDGLLGLTPKQKSTMPALVCVCPCICAGARRGSGAVEGEEEVEERSVLVLVLNAGT